VIEIVIKISQNIVAEYHKGLGTQASSKHLRKFI